MRNYSSERLTRLEGSDIPSFYLEGVFVDRKLIRFTEGHSMHYSRSMPGAPNEQWSDLCAAATDFRELGPRAWTDVGQVFGVAGPTGGEIAGCAVLGMRREVIGFD